MYAGTNKSVTNKTASTAGSVRSENNNRARAAAVQPSVARPATLHSPAITSEAMLLKVSKAASSNARPRSSNISYPVSTLYAFP